MSEEFLPPMIDLSAYVVIDLAVLRGIVATQQASGLPLDVDALIEQIGLADAVVQLSLQRLHHGGAIAASERRVSMEESAYYEVTQLTRDGLERSGAWPVPEDLAATVIGQLAEALAAQAKGASSDERERLLTTAQVIGGTAKDLAVEVAAAVIAKQMGIS